MIDGGKRNLLGVLVNEVDYEAAEEKVIDAARAGEPLGVSALAVHGVMTGVLDRTHRSRLNQLELVVPDGQPVRWALNVLHHSKLRDRVYGPTLTLKVCQRAAEEKLPDLFVWQHVRCPRSLGCEPDPSVPRPRNRRASALEVPPDHRRREAADRRADPRQRGEDRPAWAGVPPPGGLGLRVPPCDLDARARGRGCVRLSRRAASPPPRVPPTLRPGVGVSPEHRAQATLEAYLLLNPYYLVMVFFQLIHFLSLKTCKDDIKYDILNYG